MLVSITTRCDSSCTHCMNNAGRDGVDMDEDTVERVSRFMQTVLPMFIVISGGEPTLHPGFETIVHRFMKATGYQSSFIVATNGLFITDPARFEMMARVIRCSPISLVQVTRGSPFYPRDETIIENGMKLQAMGNKVQIFDINDTIKTAGSLFPAGRAIKNHPELLGNGRPKCINLYLISRQIPLDDFTGLIHALELLSRDFCKPSIDPLGNIHANECIEQCHVIGTVDDDPRDLLLKVKRGVPCDRCGLAKNLPPEARKLLFATNNGCAF